MYKPQPRHTPQGQAPNPAHRLGNRAPHTSPTSNHSCASQTVVAEILIKELSHADSWWCIDKSLLEVRSSRLGGQCTPYRFWLTTWSPWGSECFCLPQMSGNLNREYLLPLVHQEYPFVCNRFLRYVFLTPLNIRPLLNSSPFVWTKYLWGLCIQLINFCKCSTCKFKRRIAIPFTKNSKEYFHKAASPSNTSRSYSIITSKVEYSRGQPHITRNHKQQDKR